MLVWRESQVQESPTRLPADGEVVWLHLREPSDAQVEAVLGEVYGIHPLALEDVMHFGQRPKLDRYTASKRPHIFISFYTLVSDLTEAEFCVVVGEQFVITVERTPVALFAKLEHVAEADPSVMHTPATLVHRLLDLAVDQFVDMTDVLEGRVDEMQERVFAHPEAVVAPEIFRMQRDLHDVRSIATELRTVLNQLMREDAPFWDVHQQVYYADVYDHAARAADQMEAVRYSLSGLLDLQTSQRAMRMNEVMRTLTVIATIFMPLTFIVGVYGMNFHNMPELSWQFGYSYVWLLMLAVTLVMLYYFKRKGWW